MIQHSTEQTAILNWFEHGQGNLVVVARAGTGKTYTMLKGVDRAPEGRILLTAFNKVNAAELDKKLSNPNAEAMTLHSLGYRFVRRQWGSTTPDNNKMKDLLRCVEPGAPDEIVDLGVKLASKIKNILPLSQDLEEIVDLALDFDLVPGVESIEDGWTLERLAEISLAAVNKCAKTKGAVDFDDMLFLPVRNGWVTPSYDLVCIDEAQDMNAVQLILARSVCRKAGRIVVIGDDRQAIYSFRGADSSTLGTLRQELSADELKLTITRRCPRTVVALAQELVADYVAAPEAIEGSVQKIGREKMLSLVNYGDFVLSRSNAPLLDVCLQLLSKGLKARVQGKDVAQGLLVLIKKLAGTRKSTTIKTLLTKLTTWEDREIARAKTQSKSERVDARVENISNKAECLRVLIDGIRTIGELTARIEGLFADDGRPAVVCSTVHRAKGMEAEQVFVLTDTLRRAPLEELNICYVAYTRTKRDLYLVG